jgi:outer membrane immunogenic protein
MRGLSKAAAIVGSVVTLSGTVMAADLPLKAANAAPEVLYNWTGFYAGANGGWGWGDNHARLLGDTGAGSIVLASVQGIDPFGGGDPRFPLSLGTGLSGFIGGGQLGYNWQFGRRWLAGVEADIQYSDIKGGASLVEPNLGGVTYRLDIIQKLEWLGTARARLGFLVTDRFLVFGTGGLAYGETKANAAITNYAGPGHNLPGAPTALFCPAMSVCIADSRSRTDAGWAAGAGLEYAAWKNVSFKIEYLHVDLGSQNLRLIAQMPATGNGFVTASFENRYDIARVGVNVKFGP